MKPARPTVSAPVLAVVCAVFITLSGNYLFWSSLSKIIDMRTAHGFLFAVAAFVILSSALTAFFLLFSVKYLFRPALMIFLVLSAVIGYFGAGYGVIIDSAMLQNILETDSREAFELMTPSFAAHILLLGLLPALAVASTQIRSRPPIKEAVFRLSAAGLALVLALSAALFSYKDLTLMGREHKELRMALNPLYPLYSALIYGRQRKKGPRVVTPIGTDARRSGPRHGKKKTVVVFVVGETARQKQFSLNGYGRKTNPFLEKDGVISFTGAYACGTATAASLPCMFSHLDRSEYTVNKAAGFENVLDVLSRAGVSVLWRDNNSGCKGVCKRVAVENLSHSSDADFCNSEECFDEILLSGLQDRLRKTDSDQLIVLHQKGSHGPAYFKRYPRSFSVFVPECNSGSPQNCENSDIVNAYDNTILYTDYFLHKTIDLLKKNADAYDTLLVYFSDHGESLGEKSIYLHGLPYFIAPDEQTHVPLIIWMSDGYAANQKIDLNCLHAQRNNPYSHSNIFHSLLGAFNVQTEYYKENRDILAQCRSGNSLAAVPQTRPAR